MSDAGAARRLLLVRGERLERWSDLARNRAGSESARIVDMGTSASRALPPKATHDKRHSSREVYERGERAASAIGEPSTVNLDRTF